MPKVRDYLQLMRFPAVFTAMADVCLGFVLARATFSAAPLSLGLLLATSSCLYLAGMIFNDYFDREIDAAERPERPIPSGRIAAAQAARLGMLLVAVGGCAAGVVGVQSMIVAGALTACIFAYDAWLKGTVLGPVAMGGCRFLNVILGASAQESAAEVWGTFGDWDGSPQLWIAAGLGVYIAGVTWFAKNEAGKSDRKQLTMAVLLADAGLLLLLGWVIRKAGDGQANANGLIIGFGILLVVINRRLAAAVHRADAASVQAAVRIALLSLIVLDATLIYVHTGHAISAVAVVALLLPALTLGRWIYVT